MAPISHSTNTEFGVMASSGSRADGPDYAHDLGASWVRINGTIDGNSIPATKLWMEAGFNVILTTKYRVKGNVDESHASLTSLPQAGFPYKNRTNFKQHVEQYVTNFVTPYLVVGKKVILQCENEVGDITVATNEKFWGGTTSQYVTQLNAYAEAVHELGFLVACSSFTSNSIDAVTDSKNSSHTYQVSRVKEMVSNIGDYDYTDIHLYGCETAITDKITAFKAILPDKSKKIMTTETGGPVTECSTEWVNWHNNLAGFEASEASQVTQRLQTCTDNKLDIVLWFSLFDLNGEVDTFSHLGLLTQEATPRQKSAYQAFRTFIATHKPKPHPEPIVINEDIPPGHNE